MDAHDTGGRDVEGTTRRRVIAGIAVGAVTVAGCLDQGSEDPDDAGAGSGDGETGTTETSRGAETDEPDQDGNADESLESFQEAVGYEESFAVSGTIENEDGTVTMEGRFDGTDHYLRIEQDGEVFETYQVGDDQYMVTGDQCFRNPNQSVESGNVDPGSVPEDTGDLPDVRPAGRTPIDGKAMLVYEFEAAEAAAGAEEDVTYYVSAETGYLRRVEGDFGVLDYHSWGSVASVEAPDMDCESF
jgi:hypothetical protein